MPVINDIFKFLSQLEKNNNREWFKDNKDQFDILKAGWINDIQHIINIIAKNDNSLSNLEAKDCIYRIYRDIRFSNDKSPFKCYFSAVIGRGGRKCNHACYYIQVQPGGRSGLYAGLWCPDSNLLRKIRCSIDDNFEEFKEIIDSPELKENFKFIGDKLKTVPKGFDKESQSIEYLRFKDFTVEKNLSDDYFDHPDWREQIASELMKASRLNTFFNYTIDEE